MKRRTQYEPTSVYTLDVVTQTDRAFLVTDGSVEVWLPKSQTKTIASAVDARGVEVIELEIPDWLAEERGLA